MVEESNVGQLGRSGVVFLCFCAYGFRYILLLASVSFSSLSSRLASSSYSISDSTEHLRANWPKESPPKRELRVINLRPPRHWGYIGFLEIHREMIYKDRMSARVSS